MKNIKLVSLCFLISCSSQSVDQPNTFKTVLPDTSKTWAGRITRQDFLQTRDIENKLNLASLIKGTKSTEIRIWKLSGSYDPQTLNILRQLNLKEWTLQTISFYQTKSDSVSLNITRTIPSVGSPKNSTF